MTTAVLEHASEDRMEQALGLVNALGRRVYAKMMPATLSEDDVTWMRSAAVEQARLIAVYRGSAEAAEQIERDIEREDWQRLTRNAVYTTRLLKMQMEDATATGAVVDLAARRALLDAEREWQQPTPAQSRALGLDDDEPPSAS